MKFALDGAISGAPADAALVRFLVRAYSLDHHLASDPSFNLEEVDAKRMGAPYATQLMP
jgi:hypothetical protein